VPSRRVVGVWGVLLAVAGVSQAAAVDLRNRDREPREVVVNHADGRSEALKLSPGQRVANLCEDCVVLAATTSVEAKGNVTVEIERGEVSINGKR
jgi:hypothetical protein